MNNLTSYQKKIFKLLSMKGVFIELRGNIYRNEYIILLTAYHQHKWHLIQAINKNSFWCMVDNNVIKECKHFSGKYKRYIPNENITRIEQDIQKILRDKDLYIQVKINSSGAHKYL